MEYFACLSLAFIHLQCNQGESALNLVKGLQMYDDESRSLHKLIEGDILLHFALVSDISHSFHDSFKVSSQNVARYCSKLLPHSSNKLPLVK